LRLPNGLFEHKSFSKKDFCENSQVLSAACRKGHFIATPAALLTKVLKRINPFIAEPSVPVPVLKIFDGAGWRMSVKIGIVVYSYLCVVFHDNLLITIKGFFSFYSFIVYSTHYPCQKGRVSRKNPLFTKYLKIQEV
jgi:hypothetical protein